jgi:hypothetical protein
LSDPAVELRVFMFILNCLLSPLIFLLALIAKMSNGKEKVFAKAMQDSEHGTTNTTINLNYHTFIYNFYSVFEIIAFFSFSIIPEVIKAIGIIKIIMTEKSSSLALIVLSMITQIVQS